ncbi:MAG: hypothetical protein ACR2G2_08610 [Pseudonocardia sp.]
MTLTLLGVTPPASPRQPNALVTMKVSRQPVNPAYGLRFDDLCHSCATSLADDGSMPNMVQRVMSQ